MTDDDADAAGSDGDGAQAAAGAEGHGSADVEGRPEREYAGPRRIPLTDFFGDDERVRLLDAFVSTNQATLSASEIAEFGGIDTSTVRTCLDVFLDHGVIEETGTVGYSPMYALNDENDVAAAIEDLEQALADMAEDEYEEDRHEAARAEWSDRKSKRDEESDEGADGAWSGR